MCGTYYVCRDTAPPAPAPQPDTPVKPTPHPTTPLTPATQPDPTPAPTPQPTPYPIPAPSGAPSAILGEYVLMQKGEGDACESGSAVPKNECLEAALKVGEALNLHNSLNKLWSWWENFPCGCFLGYPGDEVIVYPNYNIKTEACTSKPRAQLICKEDPGLVQSPYVLQHFLQCLDQKRSNSKPFRHYN